MGTNENNNINLNTINGEYVKFYITTNSALPEILKNSGAIVIYNDAYKKNANSFISSSYVNNYIYLGNKLIASGWGLSNKELRDKAEQISSDWDSFTCDLYNTYEGICYNLSSIHELIKNTLITIDGNIDNTFITINNGTDKLLLKDFLFNSINYNYKPIEIISETNIIKYNNIINDNEYTVETKNNSIAYLPTGSNIISVTKNIKYKINDESANLKTAGFSYLYCPTQELYDINENKNNFDNVSFKKDFFIANNTLHTNINDNINEAETSFTFKYSELTADYLPNDKSFIVRNGMQNIVTDACCYTFGTQLSKLQNLSYLDTQTNTINKLNDYSVNNIIQSHNIDLSDINIFGSPFLFTYNCPINLNNNELKINDISTLGNRQLLNEINKVEILNSSYLFYFALPENILIDEIYYIDNDNQNKINITSNFIDVNNNENNYWINKYNLPTEDKIISLDENKVEYKLYCCRYFNNLTFGNNLTIYIKLKNLSYNLNTNINIENNSIVPNYDYYKIIQNNEYIDNNWIYSETDSDNNNIFFKFMDENYVYYVTNNSLDYIYNDPLNNWKLLKKFNINEITNDIIILSETEIYKYLILPYEIYKKYDFYNDNTLIEKNSKYIINIFNKQDIKFIKLKLNNGINKLIPNTKAYIGIDYNIKDTLETFLNTNGISYYEFIQKYFIESNFIDIKTESSKYKLYLVFPINNYDIIEFKIINTETNIEIQMNNIYYERINNTLYGVYKSANYINSSDKLKIIQINNK